MTSNSSLFTTFQSHPSTSTITLTDGSASCVLGLGTIHPTSLSTLTFVLSLPQFSFNLIYLSKLNCTLHCNISFFLDYCLIQDLLTKRIIGRVRESRGLYILETKVSKFVACSGVVTSFELHCRLGHPSFSLLKKVYHQFSSQSSLNCESCQYAKFHHVHLSPRVNKRASAPFELVHSDVWGHCPIMSLSGFKDFVTFIDDFSRVTWLYLMKSHSEVFSHFSPFYAEIQTQFHVTVQTLRSDNAKEYLSEPFQSFMLQHVILHQISCVDTPSQSGVSKRKNRHLLETVRALLFQMNVPKHFWDDAVSTACFFINRMPSLVLNWATPYHRLFPNNPLFPIAPKVFGCTCFVRDVRLQVSKLDPKSLKCVFVGYSRVQKGYRCYYSTLRRYLESTDLTFFETTPFSLSMVVISQGENDDLLVYVVSLPAPPTPTPAPIPVKPPIILRYILGQNPSVSSPTPTASSSDLV